MQTHNLQVQGAFDSISSLKKNGVDLHRIFKIKRSDPLIEQHCLAGWRNMRHWTISKTLNFLSRKNQTSVQSTIDSGPYSNTGNTSTRLRNLAEESTILCWHIFRRKRQVATVSDTLIRCVMLFTILPARDEVTRERQLAGLQVENVKDTPEMKDSLLSQTHVSISSLVNCVSSIWNPLD